MPFPRFEQKLAEHNLQLQRAAVEILQLNIGKICNLACVHCHVDASPRRKEMMSRETIDKILEWLKPTSISKVDLTGGAPEMTPDFRYLIERLKQDSRHIIDRCNLTILLEPGFETLASFLADHQVEIIASMPCYQPENVNAQRGNGVFGRSTEALQRLNQIGYGHDPDRPLHLVYNPIGPHLPPDQEQLEATYKRELKIHFNIVFNRLYTITNMPIARYATYLRRKGDLQAYYELLIENFNPHAIEGLMCRHTLNVSYTGEVFDCDFNQMLNLPLENHRHRYLWELNPFELEGRPIHRAQHCFGCTAGSGSSCQGALVDTNLKTEVGTDELS